MHSHDRAPTPRTSFGAMAWLVATFVSAASAESVKPPNPSDLADISPEQLAQVPVEFVTGASKYEQAIRRAPASVTVLSGEELADHNWRTLGEALQSTPGFHLRSDRFYDYIGNRGFTRSLDYNSRTLVLVNGHRINDPIYQQGAVGTDFLLDPEMIKRIEIIRGPGSSVYGSNAFYGAVNVISKRPADFLGGQISTRIDSEGGFKGRATVGNRTASGIEYLVSYTQLETPGEKHFDLPGDWRRLTGQPERVARDQDGTSAQHLFTLVRYRGLEWETAYGRRVKDVLPPVYNTSAAIRSWGMDERAYSSLRYDAHPSPDRTLTATLSYDSYRYEGLFSPASYQFTPVLPYARSHSLSAEARIRQTFFARHILLAGVEYQRGFHQKVGRTNAAFPELDVDGRSSSYFVSPFAQVDWTLGSQVFASTGVRWDNYGTGEERATPRLAVMWDVTPQTHMKLIYGESFRVPNMDERTSVEIGLIRNPALAPETNRSVELVINHDINERWKVEANGYRTRSKDLILIVPNAQVPDLSSYENKQSILTEGLEVATSAFFQSNVQLRASATFQHAWDDAFSRQTIYDAPRRLYKLSLSGPLGLPRLRGSLEGLYTSARLDSTGTKADEYLTLNATLRLTKFQRRWDLALTAYNLTDKVWCDPKNTGQIRARPRVIALRATVDF